MSVLSRYFDDLTSPQVAGLLVNSRTPVLLLPVGAIEPHGPHAPLGTDPIISMGMCDRVCDLLADDPDVRPLVLPELPYGVTRCAASFPGAVGISEDTLHALVVEVCRALVDQGLRNVVVVNNHFEPEHVVTLRRAVDTLYAQRGVRLGYLDLLRRANVARLTDEFRSGACHGGRYETSLVLADHPALVVDELRTVLPEVAVNLATAMSGGERDFRAMGLERAYCGAPAEATASEGVDTYRVLTELLVSTIRETVAANREPS